MSTESNESPKSVLETLEALLPENETLKKISDPSLEIGVTYEEASVLKNDLEEKWIEEELSDGDRESVEKAIKACDKALKISGGNEHSVKASIRKDLGLSEVEPTPVPDPVEPPESDKLATEDQLKEIEKIVAEGQKITAEQLQKARTCFKNLKNKVGEDKDEITKKVETLESALEALAQNQEQGIKDAVEEVSASIFKAIDELKREFQPPSRSTYDLTLANKQLKEFREVVKTLNWEDED